MQTKTIVLFSESDQDMQGEINRKERDVHTYTYAALPTLLEF
jgi:hypothetical protein